MVFLWFELWCKHMMNLNGFKDAIVNHKETIPDFQPGTIYNFV